MQISMVRFIVVNPAPSFCRVLTVTDFFGLNEAGAGRAQAGGT